MRVSDISDALYVVVRRRWLIVKVVVEKVAEEDCDDVFNELVWQRGRHFAFGCGVVLVIVRDCVRLVKILEFVFVEEKVGSESARS